MDRVCLGGGRSKLLGLGQPHGVIVQGHERGRPEGEDVAVTVGEVDAGHEHGAPFLHRSSRRPDHARRRCRTVKVDVELQGDRHAIHHVLGRQQAGDHVSPHGQDGRPQVVRARHMHLGDDGSRALETFVGGADTEAELAQDVLRATAVRRPARSSWLRLGRFPRSPEPGMLRTDERRPRDPEPPPRAPRIHRLVHHRPPRRPQRSDSGHVLRHQARRGPGQLGPGSGRPDHHRHRRRLRPRRGPGRAHGRG
jgi:hypothetical protein